MQQLPSPFIPHLSPPESWLVLQQASPPFPHPAWRLLPPSPSWQVLRFGLKVPRLFEGLEIIVSALHCQKLPVVRCRLGTCPPATRWNTVYPFLPDKSKHGRLACPRSSTAANIAANTEHVVRHSAAYAGSTGWPHPVLEMITNVRLVRGRGGPDLDRLEQVRQHRRPLSSRPGGTARRRKGAPCWPAVDHFSGSRGVPRRGYPVADRQRPAVGHRPIPSCFRPLPPSCHLPSFLDDSLTVTHNLRA